MLLDNRCLEQISNRKHTLHLQAVTMHCNILRYENYNVLVYAGFIDPLATSAAEVNERRLASNCTCAIDTVAIVLLWQIISPDVYDKVFEEMVPNSDYSLTNLSDLLIISHIIQFKLVISHQNQIIYLVSLPQNFVA